MNSPKANTVFLKGLRYLFFIWLPLLVLVTSLSISFRANEHIVFTNLALAFISVVFTAFIISFLTSYHIVKNAIKQGEINDTNILTKNGKLNLNFLNIN